MHRSYKYKYGNYRFYLHSGLTLKGTPFIFLMGILPFLPNDFETMTGKSDGQLYFVSGFMCVLYTGVILF